MEAKEVWLWILRPTKTFLLPADELYISDPVAKKRKSNKVKLCVRLNARNQSIHGWQIQLGMRAVEVYYYDYSLG